MFSYLALVAGILSALLYPLIKSKLAALVILFLSLIIYIWIKNKHEFSYKKLLKYILLILIAYSYGTLKLLQNQSQLITESIPAILVSGHLASLPVTNNKGQHAEFKITDGTFDGYKIIIYYPESSTLAPGNKYQLQLNLKPLDISKNIHAMDYRQYLISNHISGFGYLKQIIQDQGADYSFEAQLTKTRYNLVNYLNNILENEKYAALIVALISGYQNQIPDTQWQLFRNTGITHLVSISGLHITLVATIIVFLVNLLLRRLPIKLHTPIQIIALWSGVTGALIYSLIAGFSIPTQRTFYLLLVSAILLSSRRHIPLLNKLTITAALVLIIDPFAGLSSSFWLSFGMVATIFMISEGYQKFTNKLHFWIILQLAITLVSMPISLYLFKTYSLISVIANLWAVPLIGTLLTPALLLAAALHLSSGLILLANILKWIMLPIEFLGEIQPYWQMSPNFATIVIAYIGIILLFIPRSLPYKNIVGLCLFCSLFIITGKQIALGQIRFTIFSSSQAAITLIQTQSNNILIDMPHNENLEKQLSSIKNTLIPYLQTEYITHIDYLISDNSNIESNLADILNSNQIKPTNRKVEENTLLDGVEFRLIQNKQDYALKIKDISGNYYYFGNGIKSDKEESNWKIVSLSIFPWKNPEWIYSSHIGTLVISYPNTYSNKMTRITDNLNLDTEKIHDTNKNGSFSYNN
jgi:competence protein ComEC